MEPRLQSIDKPSTLLSQARYIRCIFYQPIQPVAVDLTGAKAPKHLIRRQHVPLAKSEFARTDVLCLIITRSL
jgi:hypothetical protein